MQSVLNKAVFWYSWLYPFLSNAFAGMHGLCRGFCFHVPAIPAFARSVKGCAGSDLLPMGSILHQKQPVAHNIFAGVGICPAVFTARAVHRLYESPVLRLYGRQTQGKPGGGPRIDRAGLWL
jgi:hypothetical protein